MKIGLIGLGKMGRAFVTRLVAAGHEVIGFDIEEGARAKARDCGATTVNSIHGVAKATSVIWLMVPPGKVIDEILSIILGSTPKPHIIIDGGNSHFKDSVRRANSLKAEEIAFIDCGTSGGLAGEKVGFSLMVGGDLEAYKEIKPLLNALAMPHGCGHVGQSGAGHYVKMVHNGIEYALMQAYAEGFHLLKEGSYRDLDLEQISAIWSHGSIIRSHLLHLCKEIFTQDQNFKDVVGSVGTTGMGQWTVEEALVQKVPVQLIQDSVTIRQRSQETRGNYATKLVALLRHAFGGHAYKKNQKD